MDLEVLIENVLNALAAGITIGCIYGLMCIGLGLIFGIMRIVNFKASCARHDRWPGAVFP